MSAGRPATKRPIGHNIHGYRCGCRCPICLAARANHQRRYQQRRRAKGQCAWCPASTATRDGASGTYYCAACAEKRKALRKGRG